MKYIILLVVSFFMSVTSCKSSKDASEEVVEQVAKEVVEKKVMIERKVPQRELPQAIQEYHQMDSDKDGKVSKSEAKGKLAENFDKLDADKDGFVTLEELEKAPPPE